MSSLDNLPGDQRAVLEMVLARGRSYDEIARLLSLERSAVRERAQIALDAIGPHAEVAPEHQNRIADYLLGQLPDDEAAEVRGLLAGSPTDRAWARVVASELAPLTGGNPLPEIPAAEPHGPAAAATSPPPAVATEVPDEERKRPRGRRRRKRDDQRAAATGSPRTSRLGGAVILLTGVVVVAAVLFFVLRGGHSKNHTPSTTVSSSSAPAASASTPTSSTPTTSTSGTSASVVAQINLSPPASDKSSKAAGIAEVLNEGSVDGVAIVAQNVPANKSAPHPNAYAVWLYNSAKDAKILGFVNPAVGKTGRLSTAGRLPTNASHYKQLIVTVETTASPKQPGSIVLQGALTGL
jgi:anti-sigma factor RsiW